MTTEKFANLDSVDDIDDENWWQKTQSARMMKKKAVVIKPKVVLTSEQIDKLITKKVMEHENKKLADKRAGQSMIKELEDWAKKKSKRESNMLAMMERLRLPKLPPHAVLMKPRGQTAMNKKKLFKDEAEFLEIESSLDSSESSESEKMSPKFT